MYTFLEGDDAMLKEETFFYTFFRWRLGFLLLFFFLLFLHFKSLSFLDPGLSFFHTFFTII